MPASSRMEVTSCDGLVGRQPQLAAGSSAYSRTAEAAGSSVSGATRGPRGVGLQVVGQGRRDDVAGLEVAVRRGPLGLAGCEHARRRRRRPRRPGPRRPAARSCGPPSPRRCAAPARPARLGRRRRGRRPGAEGRRRRGPRADRAARSARRGAARGLGRACSCTSASARAGTAPPSPGAGRPRSPAGIAPTVGSCPARAGPAIRAPRGCSRNSGLPVLEGCAPASNPAKSLFSSASAGRFPVALVTISGASIATRQSPSTYGARAATIVVVGGRRGHVHQLPVVVEDGQAGGLAVTPREVDSDEVHDRSLPYCGRWSYWVTAGRTSASRAW